MGAAILQGARNDGMRVYQSVALGDDAAIDGARLMLGARTMVFGSACYHLDLLGREPLAQTLITANQATARQVVLLASLGETKVVIGGCGKQHGGIDLGIILCKMLRLGHHRMSMVATMTGVEGVISRNNFPLKEIAKGI
jgi:hypothetical protein